MSVRWPHLAHYHCLETWRSKWAIQERVTDDLATMFRSRQTNESLFRVLLALMTALDASAETTCCRR